MQRTFPNHAEESLANDVQNRLRRRRRFRRTIVGCVCLVLVFVVDCRGTRVAVGAPPEESFITVRNPQVLPPQIVADRIPLGITGDYKPSLALLPGGELLLVMFHGVDQGGGKTREDMINRHSWHDGFDRLSLYSWIEVDACARSTCEKFSFYPRCQQFSRDVEYVSVPSPGVCELRPQLTNNYHRRTNLDRLYVELIWKMSIIGLNHRNSHDGVCHEMAYVTGGDCYGRNRSEIVVIESS